MTKTSYPLLVHISLSKMASTKLPRSFPPTESLRTSAERLGEAIQEAVAAIPSNYTGTLKYSNFVDVVAAYESFYEEVNGSILHIVRDTNTRQYGTSIRPLLPPGYTGGPQGIIVVQSGEVPIRNIASAITLLRIGHLESVVEGRKEKPTETQQERSEPADEDSKEMRDGGHKAVVASEHKKDAVGVGQRESVDWGSTGSVTYLPGNSIMRSSGDGKIVCLFRTMQSERHSIPRMTE